jgi:hypothetical protein
MSTHQTSGAGVLPGGDAWGARLPPELASAPIDDEPETPEEAARVAEARAAVARGEIVSHEELGRRLGLV